MFRVYTAALAVVHVPCADEIAHGHLWELTSYEWMRKSGLARFGYTHRYTGEHREVYREQPRYWSEPVEEVAAQRRGRFHMEVK